MEKSGNFHTFSSFGSPVSSRRIPGFGSVDSMSSRPKSYGAGRGKGGPGGFKRGGGQISSQKHKGVSLDGFIPAGSSAAFVNGQFRESGADHMKKRKKKGVSRKEQRKKTKDERKERTREYELRKQARKLGVDPEEFIEQNSRNKKRKRDDMEEEHEDMAPEYESSEEEEVQRPIKKAKSRAEAMDDKIIKEMEKKLGLDPKKKKAFGDGLDSLFDGIGSDAEAEEGSNSDEEEDGASDEAPRPRKAIHAKDIFGKGWKGDGESSGKKRAASDDEEGESDLDDSDDEGMGEFDSDVDMESQSGDEYNSDEDGNSENDEDDEEDMDGSEEEDGENDLESGSDFGLGADDGSTDSEDDGSMFGRGNPFIKFDSESEEEDGEEGENSKSESDSEDMPAITPVSASSVSAPKAGMYIPPALRARLAAASGEDTQRAQMLRELRGHVNRLSDSNIESIFELIEVMFSKYPRKAMTDELVRILVDDCIASVGGATVFTFAPTYSALTMMLHLTVGAEIGGAVVQGCARELQTRLEQNDIAVSRNLLLMFISFYNYLIIHCSMVYDIIRLLIERMNEQNVDLLLLLIQKCGMSLRKDDAQSIKGIISSVNEVTSEWKANWDARDQSKDEAGRTRRFVQNARFSRQIHEACAIHDRIAE